MGKSRSPKLSAVEVGHWSCRGRERSGAILEGLTVYAVGRIYRVKDQALGFRVLLFNLVCLMAQSSAASTSTPRKTK